MSRDWAIVTGASRGIGRAIALALAEGPWHVVLTFVESATAADDVVRTIISSGGSAEAIRLDVRDHAAAATAIEALIERLGAPWAVVNNAGITRDGLMVWMEAADWNDVVETNLGGFFNVTRPCLKSMISSRRGRIISITSTAGQMGSPGQVNYSASKAGLIGATRALAREVAKRGITVNAVAPGYTRTDMTAGLREADLSATIPLGRFGRPEEVAAAVRFLASEEAGYVTGQVISVNGGIT